MQNVKRESFPEGRAQLSSKRVKSCSLVFMIKEMQSKSPRMLCLYSVCWKSDNTIIIALENRNYHVNLGTAILFWVSALEKLCTPVHQGKMAQKLLSSIVHGKQDLETAQRSMLIEQGVLIQGNSKSCNENKLQFQRVYG